MLNVPLQRTFARWVVALALAAPLTSLGIGSPVTAFSAAAPLGATVSVLSAPVDVASADAGAAFTPASDGQTLLVGDTLRTGPGGMALLTFFDGSESQLGGESAVQLEQVSANPAPQIALLQTAGVTVNHVIPMPAGGSFRTDTPVATGLVRGTSYIVIVGPAGTCGATGNAPCGVSMILLTDRTGHVGRVDVTANGSTMPAVQLSAAGDAAAASNLVATGTHFEPAVLAELESVAHVPNDPAAALTTERDARAIAAGLTPPAGVVPPPPAPPVDASSDDGPAHKAAETDSRPPLPSSPVVGPPAHSDDAGPGKPAAAPAVAPSPPAHPHTNAPTVAPRHEVHASTPPAPPSPPKATTHPSPPAPPAAKSDTSSKSAKSSKSDTSSKSRNAKD